MTAKTQKTVKNLALYIWGGGLAPQAPDTRHLCRTQCIAARPRANVTIDNL